MQFTKVMVSVGDIWYHQFIFDVDKNTLINLKKNDTKTRKKGEKGNGRNELKKIHNCTSILFNEK